MDEVWFRTMVRAATVSPAGQLLVRAGFQVVLNGGGCLAWRKDGPHGIYLLLGDGYGGLHNDLSAVELASTEWMVGLYNADCSAWMEEIISDLQCAIMCADGFLAKPQRYLDGDIRVAEQRQAELEASYVWPGHA